MWPDLNPIEHIWDMLGRRIQAREHPVQNIRQLKKWGTTTGCKTSPHAPSKSASGNISGTVKIYFCSGDLAICFFFYLRNNFMEAICILTSFKRFESKPVVKIIYTYTHCNL
jgi:hypothetical protein